MHLHAACYIIVCFYRYHGLGKVSYNSLTSPRIGPDAQGGPILVHCMDGASQSGLFVTVYTVCEKMKLEQEVDVFHTVKHLKTRRKHCVNSLVLYHILFDEMYFITHNRM